MPGSRKAFVICRVAAVTAELLGRTSWLLASRANFPNGVNVTDSTTTNASHHAMTSEGRRRTTLANSWNMPLTDNLIVRLRREIFLSLAGQFKFTSSHG